MVIRLYKHKVICVSDSGSGDKKVILSYVILCKLSLEIQILNGKSVLYLNILLFTDICIVIHFVEILLSEEGIV